MDNTKEFYRILDLFLSRMVKCTPNSGQLFAVHPFFDVTALVSADFPFLLPDGITRDRLAETDSKWQIHI